MGEFIAESAKDGGPVGQAAILPTGPIDKIATPTSPMPTESKTAAGD